MAIAGDLSMAVEGRAGNYSASMGRCVILAVGEMLIFWSLGTWINEPIVNALALHVKVDQMFVLSNRCTV